MGIEIVDAVGGVSRWQQLLRRFDDFGAEPYFAPEYARLYCAGAQDVALLFAYHSADQLWVDPAVVRPIPSVGNCAASTSWKDRESPNGYTGPLSTTSDPDFLAEAHEALRCWCRETKIVSGFTRLHPLIGNQRWVDPDATTIVDRQTVSLDLRGFSLDNLPFDSATRNMIRRAQRSLVVEQGVDCLALTAFQDNYLRQMEDFGAPREYHFDANYFAGLLQQLGRAIWLLTAREGAEWVGASMFIHGPKWLHYHLACSARGRRAPGLANLLIALAADLGSKCGLERLHLGGGRTPAPDDSLLAFKQTMAPDSHHFRVSRAIYLPDEYLSLVSAWADEYPELTAKYGSRHLCYRYRP